MTRLLGQMSEEERLEFEQATGIRTAGAIRIVEEARQQAERMIQTAIREVQEIIGPHGSVTRVQAGSLRVSRSGMGVYEDGILKTIIESDGDFFVGSDTALPATTTFSVFANEQTYNNELMGQGDLLIGDNTAGAFNVWYDSDEGEIHFRVGRLTSLFIDAFGGIKTNDPNNITGGDLNIINEATGKAIRLYIELTNLTTPYVKWHEDVSNANAAELQINAAATPTVIVIGGDNNSEGNASVVIWAALDGKETVFNSNSYDIDFRVEGATDANLLKIDAGLDRVGIGVAVPGYKLDVAGDVNTSTGFFITGVNINDNIIDNILPFYSTPADGWQNKTGTTWTRTGNHTFTVSGDLTATYRKGAKVRYKDGGAYEYGVVGSSSHAAGTTTVNLIPNTDYAMAAATITNNYISYIENPEGFPQWFNWAWSPTNLTVGTQVAKWKAIPQGVFYEISATGSTIAGDVTFTPPVASTATGARPPVGEISMFDSGVNNYYGAVIQTGSTTFAVRVNQASGTYTTNVAISGTVPFTWGASDELNIKGFYPF